jgi:hypothetical protein
MRVHTAAKRPVISGRTAATAASPRARSITSRPSTWPIRLVGPGGPRFREGRLAERAGELLDEVRDAQIHLGQFQVEGLPGHERPHHSLQLGEPLGAEIDRGRNLFGEAGVEAGEGMLDPFQPPPLRHRRRGRDERLAPLAPAEPAKPALAEAGGAASAPSPEACLPSRKRGQIGVSPG